MELLRERYEIGEVIGAGGAARVYRADDPALDRTVAIKLLDDAIARSADPAARARFLQEAKLAARVRHPNLVTVFDAGEDDGVLFLVMEFVDGITLADRIASHSPLPVDEALSIARQMLDGLDALHESGAIHRDIKPANVLVGHDGFVRLADFGIAKRLDELDAAVTAVGTLVGTPHYLTPEQATGRPQSPATDVYQVGLVLHEMLTGQRVGGGDPLQAARARPADPRNIRPDVPEHVANAVVRATQPAPEDRFQSAHEMRAALDVTDTATVASMTAAGAAGRTMTMPMPAHEATSALTAIGGTPAGATRILDPGSSEPKRNPRGWPAAVRPLMTAAAAVAAVAVVSGAAALALSDGGPNPMFGVDDPAAVTTSLAPATSLPPAAPATTVAVVVAPATTAPVATAPAPAPPAGRGDGEKEDKPGKGNGRDKDDD